MAATLSGKNILLGVCGSIAAYKTADWVSKLTREEAVVQVVMTRSAQEFISPLTFTALSGQQTLSNMFDLRSGAGMAHITLGKDADIIVVAPATAQTIARLAHGFAEDLLSTLILAASGKVIVCPAMNTAMYRHPATVNNLEKIKAYGYQVIAPEEGHLACGDTGSGRLADWPLVRQMLLAAISPQDLAGKNILISAGPTHEPLDPVRFISNNSSGKMGYALANTAQRRGAAVTLISGPVHLPPPPGVRVIAVKTAMEMYQEVLDRFDQTDIVVKAAAVSDFRPAALAANKLKKNTPEANHLALQENPDILAKLGEMKAAGKKGPVLVGFAAETENLAAEGLRKLTEKNLDLIAVNDVSRKDAGFGVDTNQITMLARDGSHISLPLLTKEETADRMWDQIARMVELRL